MAPGRVTHKAAACTARAMAVRAGMSAVRP